MKRSASMGVAFAALMLAGTAATAPASATDYYAGKTVSMVVGFEPGGGTDTMARIWADRLSPFIPGQPTVIVNNMPGAATMKAHNYVFEVAKRDGLQISFNPFQLTAQLGQTAGIRFRYEDYTVIAGLRGSNTFAFANAKMLPGGKPEDIMKAPRKLMFAGRNAIHAQDATLLLALDLLGAKYRYVAGYNNADKLLLAVRTGEMDISVIEVGRWVKDFEPNFVPAGEVVPLWQFLSKGPDGKFVKAKEYGDMPSFEDVYERIHGKPPSGELWDAYQLYQELRALASFLVLGPPNMDKAALATLRQGFRRTAESPDVQSAMLKIYGSVYDYVPPEEIEAAFDKLRKIDEKQATFWKARLNAAN